VGDAGALLRRFRRGLSHQPARAEQAGTGGGTLAGLGLRLHPDKTRIVCICTTGKEGFDFLGFHHRMVESWKQPGRYYLQKWPSARAMASYPGQDPGSDNRRLRQPGHGHRCRAELNPVLRGWRGCG
jgi:RNA-directed DNA polymerase